MENQFLVKLKKNGTTKIIQTIAINATNLICHTKTQINWLVRNNLLMLKKQQVLDLLRCSMWLVRQVFVKILKKRFKKKKIHWGAVLELIWLFRRSKLLLKNCRIYHRLIEWWMRRKYPVIWRKEEIILTLIKLGISLSS